MEEEKTYKNTLKPFANNWRENDTLVSETWSGGGTVGSCWDNRLSTIAPDAPKEFVEFDEMLSKICPNISYLQYKTLYNTCHEIITYNDRDYYGGCETILYHKCDLQKLWGKMKEMELV